MVARDLHYGEHDWAPIATAMRRNWSPTQIVGRARRHQHPMMSTETINCNLRRNRRHRGNLWRALRIVSKFGRKRRGSPITRCRMVRKLHISERPAAVERRRHLGHREDDNVSGADQRHCILALVERVAGFLIIKKLIARNVEQANPVMRRAIKRLNTHFRTITLDNGTEFHGYPACHFYFATHYRSWERGTNANTNGLIRRHRPKMLELQQAKLKLTATRLLTN